MDRLHDDGYTCVVWRKHPCQRLTPARFPGLEAGFDGGGGGLSIVSGNGTLATTLRNTIIWGNKVLPVRSLMLTGFGGDLFMNGVGSLVVTGDHLDVGERDTLAGTFTDLGGNLNVDPGLRRDFHLKADSPLIDVGTCTGAPATDFEGDPRPTGAGCDIGADEVAP